MTTSKEIVLSREGKEPKFTQVNCNPFRIGSSPVSELQLSDKAIPRHQCDIIETETGYELLDRSGIGTEVDGKKVKSAKLSDKSVIKIGGYRLHLRNIPAGFEIDNTITHLGADKKSKDSIENVLSLVGKSPSGPIKVVVNDMIFTIGSKDGNNLTIKDPCVSGRHCTISDSEKPGLWKIYDACSKNGTFVDDVRITKKGLRHGMVIRVGDTILRVLAGRHDVDYPGYGGIISEDPAMDDVFERVYAAAPSGAPVLLSGETGTGKGAVARLIHFSSKRATKQFLSKNCSVLPKNIIESELFGHKKGSFTGANEDKIGLFEAASGGTLFLDEVGEIPLELQSKFLQVVEDQEIIRVGETETRKVDTQIISATNRSLENMIREGRFREDLYFRISVFNIHLPPLRDRPKDIPLLARYFLETYTRDEKKKLSRSALSKLQEFDYPGNVRDLKNTITRAAEMCKASTIGPDHIEFTPVTLADRKAENTTYYNDEQWEEHQQRYLEEALEAHSWNQAETARALGIDRNKIARLIKKYGLKRPK